VRAMLGNPAVFQDGNFVRHTHGTEAMGDKDGCAAGSQFREVIVHLMFAGGFPLTNIKLTVRQELHPPPPSIKSGIVGSASWAQSLRVFWS